MKYLWILKDKKNQWLNNLPNWIVKPKYEIINRSQRRDFIRSHRKIVTEILDAENDFLKDLNQAFSNLTYSEIYGYYLEHFAKIIKWHEMYGKHKNVIINHDYFCNKYKPTTFKP